MPVKQTKKFPTLGDALEIAMRHRNDAKREADALAEKAGLARNAWEQAQMQYRAWNKLVDEVGKLQLKADGLWSWRTQATGQLQPLQPKESHWRDLNAFERAIYKDFLRYLEEA